MEKDLVDKIFDKIENFYNNKSLHKQISKYFLLFTGILVASPFIYPLANPFNNPNTPIENYPFALQEVYAEAQTFTSYTERFKDYEIEHASKTTNYYRSGLEPYVLDPSDKKYKDSFITQNTTNCQHIT